jgi:ParB/RepB/Spo0J family partition protein
MDQSVYKIPVSQIKESPYQGRILIFGTNTTDSTTENIRQLALNIEKNGLLYPVMLRRIGPKYEIIDGHRRVEAFRILGKMEIEAILMEIDEREAQLFSLVSNLMREDLSTIERALAFRKILQAGIFKNQKELSEAIGKDQTYVGDILNTLNMDKRIIDDLLVNQCTNDVRLLRAIRRAGKTNEQGVSAAQWELYQKFRETGLSREEVCDLSRKVKEKQIQGIKVNFLPRRIEIELDKRYNRSERIFLTSRIHKEIEKILSSKSLKYTKHSHPDMVSPKKRKIN